MKVSIVIPTYNRSDYLARLLKTILNQTYTSYEVIVVDDNSPLDADYEKVVKEYSALFDEFRFVRNPKNSGAPFSRNTGIGLAKYDLIALVDDDDEWLPEKLSLQVSKFKDGNENLGIVYTWTQVLDEKRNIISVYRSEKEGVLKREILKECFIPSPSVMVRKKAIVEAGLFDENFPSCQDWDMWTRIIFKGYSVGVVREVLTTYNKHGGESIGLSSNARKGYRMFFKKNVVNAIYDYTILIRYFKMLIKRK